MASNTVFSNDFASEDESECSCPICFRTSTETLMQTKTSHDSNSKESGSNLDYVHSRTCGHIFCLPCIQQILLVSSFTKRTRTMHQLREDEHVVTSTQGECPMCRADLSYFDLLKVLLIQAKDDKYSTTRVVKSQDPIVSLDPIPRKLFDTKFHSNDESYILFPKDITTQNVKLYTPYFKEFVPTGVLELTGYTYLARTKTFKARAKKIATSPNIELTIWLNFSDNFQFITHGVCRKVDRRRYYEEVAGESYPQLRTEVKAFVYPISVNDSTLMCRATPPKYPSSVQLPYASDSFWGNIFCQQYMVGLASYHFVKKPNSDGTDKDGGGIAYISYDHKMTSVWPPLDDGRPVPSRVFFRNITCPDQYTFRGSICWYEDYQTTWNGCCRWDYEIKFDTAFLCIRTGTVHSISMNHDNENVAETEVVSIMSTFGVELNYINAGICNTLIDSAVTICNTASKSERIAALETFRSRKLLMINQTLERLQAEGAVESTYSGLLYLMHFATHDTVAKLLEYCQRDASGQGGEMKLDDYPLDLDYYFE